MQLSVFKVSMTHQPRWLRIMGSAKRRETRQGRCIVLLTLRGANQKIRNVSAKRLEFPTRTWCFCNYDLFRQPYLSKNWKLFRQWRFCTFRKQNVCLLKRFFSNTERAELQKPSMCFSLVFPLSSCIYLAYLRNFAPISFLISLLCFVLYFEESNKVK